MLRFAQLIILLGFALSACHSSSTHDGLIVGTIAGPETQLMEVAQRVAKQHGLTLKIVEFTDYVQPNAALNDGSIDANMFQHQPFLDQQIKDRGYHLVSVGKTFLFPMAVYSQKIKQLKDLPQKASVAIPNDPSNEGRALLLLAKAGLITLKNKTNLSSTLADIVANPHLLQFKELDAAYLSRSLHDVDIAVINTNFAIPAGLSPLKDAIYHEGYDSPYANIIVVRAADKNSAKVKALVAAIQSADVEKAANTIFNGQALVAWSTDSSNTGKTS